MRMPGKKKNTPRPAQQVGKSAKLCMQCGRPATMTWIDERGEITVRTTWCQLHEPDAWKMVARARAQQEKRQLEAEQDRHEWQLQGWPA